LNCNKRKTRNKTEVITWQILAPPLPYSSSAELPDIYFLCFHKNIEFNKIQITDVYDNKKDKIKFQLKKYECFTVTNVTNAIKTLHI